MVEWENRDKNLQSDIAREKEFLIPLPGFTIGPFAWIKTHYHLGRLYQKKGETGLAIEYFKIIIDLWKGADRIVPEVYDSKEKLKQLSKSG